MAAANVKTQAVSRVLRVAVSVHRPTVSLMGMTCLFAQEWESRLEGSSSLLDTFLSFVECASSPRVGRRLSQTLSVRCVGE